MIEVSSCVICAGKIRHLKRAMVAPFLSWRIWKSASPIFVNLVRCEACGFVFYNPRLDDTELHREYGNYRSSEYLEMRNSFEPWYTEKFNASLASDQHYATRRAKLIPLLRYHLGDRKIERILDYGGDHGDLMIGLIEDAELFLFDISEANAADGVKPIRDPAACRADLIINSNVLEHVGFPRSLVNQILQAAPEGGLLFFEVPSESPLGLKRIIRRAAQIGITAFGRPRFAAQITNAAALYMMHEHINFFTENCLTTLLHSCGASVIASGSYPLVSPAGNEKVAWCLARKNNISSPESCYDH